MYPSHISSQRYVMLFYLYKRWLLTWHQEVFHISCCSLCCRVYTSPRAEHARRTLGCLCTQALMMSSKIIPPPLHCLFSLADWEMGRMRGVIRATSPRVMKSPEKPRGVFTALWFGRWKKDVIEDFPKLACNEVLKWKEAISQSLKKIGTRKMRKT